MRKARWLVMVIAVVAVTSLAIALTPPVALESGGIRAYETVIAYLGGWQVRVQYEPGGTMAEVTLRMDGMSNYRDVGIEAVSTEPWAPRWAFHIQGQPSEFLTLRDGWTQTPYPMTAALAGDLARSYQVRLIRDGHPVLVFDFAQAGFAVPAPPDPNMRHRLVTP